MTESQLLSTEEFKINDLNDINDNRKIRIIYMNGNVIILSVTVNIIKDTLEDLYDKIQIETNKVNITGMIVNKCVYNHKHKCSNSTNNCINTLFIRIEPLILSTFLKDFYEEYNDENYYSKNYNKNYNEKCNEDENNNEDYNKDDNNKDYNENYNKDYIEVSLIVGSYFPYVRSILSKYCNILGYIDNQRDHVYQRNHEYRPISFDIRLLDDQLMEARRSYISSLSKLTNNYILSDDYDLIKIYLIEKNTRDSFFLLNKMKKYLSNN